MASTSGRRRGDLLDAGFARLVRAAVPGPADAGPGCGRPGPDLVVARSLASAGLGGLVGLPFLLLASIALEIPLAGPAVIALGFLAGARETAMNRPRRALAWTAAVLAGLVAWPLVSLMAGDGQAGGPALAALLLAPVFAAAPALARSIVTPKPPPGAAAALRSVACLDRLAPDEAVLFLSRSGTICAGTRAGLSALGLPSHAAGGDVADRLAMTDRPALLEALACCDEDGGEVEIIVRPAGGEAAERLVAAIASGPEDLLTMRIRPAAAGDADGAAGARMDCHSEREASPDPVAPGAAASICRLDREIEPILRNAEAKARGKRIALTCGVEPGLAAIGDPRLCRRMLGVLLGSAIGRASAGAEIEVLTRPLKGVALLRISVSCDEAAGDIWDVEKLAIIGAVADQLGGTALAERRPGHQRISVRLALAPSRMAVGTGERSKEAG